MPPWFSPGARQTINEKDRIIELRNKIMYAASFVGGIQFLFCLLPVVILSLLDYDVLIFVFENIKCVIALFLIPLFVGGPPLLYVIIRDVFDPNFEPVNKAIARTKPLIPGRDLVERGLNWLFRTLRK